MHCIPIWYPVSSVSTFHETGKAVSCSAYFYESRWTLMYVFLKKLILALYSFFSPSSFTGYFAT